MRHRHRYIAFELLGNADKQDVYKTAAFLCNTLGLDRTEIKIIMDGTNPGKGLFRCIHSRADGIKTTMSQDDMPLRVLGVSGTIRAARRNFFTDKT